jgi:putative heme-binding domain-containing protein
LTGVSRTPSFDSTPILRAVAFLICAMFSQRITAAETSFEVPNGFEVEVVAGDQLVHDAFCMTTDSKGQPIVSGPGYVRTLIDDDGNGVYDRYVNWTNAPKEGAQGLWSEGRMLLWVGDGGLWKSIDQNGDFVADGKAEKILTLPTGGEHDAHAIRRGPDGWWYLIVGNYANDIQKINRSSDPIVKRPRAGTIWRISPDFSSSTAWAHGFRNAYDFDFLPNGRIVTFDSDEEREVSLPWYRPTRVMVVSPGDDAGWVDSAWYDADDSMGMPQVISKLGRGSPTGVAVYQHSSFPQKYSGAAFVLDWTFGRVIAVYPQPGETQAARFMAETFMQSSGTDGFAPTDICIGLDGSLLVCVGGRGTSGAIYRVRYTSTENLAPENLRKKTDLSNIENRVELLAALLDLPNPWESWSVARWIQPLSQLPDRFFADVLSGSEKLGESNPVRLAERRLRIAQYATYLGKDLPAESLAKAIETPCSVTQSAAFWYIGRGRSKLSQPQIKGLLDKPLVPPNESESTVSTFDALLGGLVERQRLEVAGLKRVPMNSVSLSNSDDWRIRKSLRQASLWALSRVPRMPVQPVSTKTNSVGPDFDQRYAGLLFGTGSSTIDSQLMDNLARRITSKAIGNEPDQLLETVSILQSALGDIRFTVPLQQSPPNVHALDGYRATYSKNVPEKVREGWVRWCLSLLNSEGADAYVIENEAIRLLAKFESTSEVAVAALLQGISQESHPTSDLHRLAALSCCKAVRSLDDTLATVRALNGVIEKVDALDLNTESRWNTRLEQIFRELVSKDAAIASSMVPPNTVIQAKQLFWLAWCPSETQKQARAQIVKQLMSEPVASWDPDLLRFANHSTVENKLIEQLRAESYEKDPTLRIELISRMPIASDYGLMLDQLKSDNRMVWPLAMKALAKLSVQDPKLELETLTLMWAKLQQSPLIEITGSTIAPRLRSAVLKLQIPSPPTNESWDAWRTFLRQHLSQETTAKLQGLAGTQADWLANVQASAKINGDPKAGEALYQRAKCAQCHGSGNALGPNLAGVSRRFSREDLFRAIYEPSRDVPDRYRAIKVLSTDGEVFVGMKVYDSVDVVTLQTGDGKVVRINQASIENRSTSPISLMPSGLLDGFSQQELADLYSYIRGL